MSDNKKTRLKLINKTPTRVATRDGLQNLYSKMGTSSDVLAQSKFVMSPPSNVYELDAAYRDAGIAKKIVDIPAFDATREWRTFNGEYATEIQKEEKRLQVQQRFQDLIKYSRHQGGAAILMITNQPLDKPLDLDKIGKGDLKRLLTFDRWELSYSALNVTNPIAENFMLPEYYQVYGNGQHIHHSHFVRMVGVPLARRLSNMEGTWGDSILRSCMTSIIQFENSKQGIATLINKANIDVFKREGLFNELTSDQEDEVINRFTLMRMGMSNLSMALLDGEEEMERHQISFGGLSDIINEQRSWVASVADIPVTRLFGDSAKGLNATGEGDVKNYYDHVSSMQESEYRQSLEKLDYVLVRSAIGGYPDDIEFEWNVLYKESGTERAQQELAASSVDSTYLDLGVVTKSQVMRKLQAEGRYNIKDEDIEEMETREKEELENGADIDELQSLIGELSQGNRGNEAEKGEKV